MPKTVLVLDDSEELRDCMVLTLEDAGYHVLTASGPELALRILRKRHVDVVVTDIIQQGSAQGLDFISAIQRDLAPPRPPIIACSGFPDFAEEAQRRGAWTFLDKPFTTDDLLGAVEAALTGRQPAAEVLTEIAARSRRFRNRAATEAEAFFRDLDARRPGFRERANRAARWVGSYLGVRHAIMVGLVDRSMRIEASNNEALLPVGERVDERLPLCRDVVETSARLLLPDVTAFSMLSQHQQQLSLRSFAAVPLLAPSGLSVGALCVFDDRPGGIEVEDLSLLEQLGRRAAGLLQASNGGGDLPPFFECGDLLSHDGFSELLGMEMRRIHRLGGGIELVVIGTARRFRDGAWLEAVSRMTRGRRRALASLGHEKLALFVTSHEHATAARDVVIALEQLREHLGTLSVGAVAVAGGEAPGLHEHELLRLADALVKRAQPGVPARVAIRAEAWSVDDRPPELPSPRDVAAIQVVAPRWRA